MRRISTPTAAQDMFGPGKHGFRNGDPANAILATRLQAEWFNALQEEVAGVVEESGQSLDVADSRQLLKAVRRLSSTYLAKSVAGGVDVTLSESESQNSVLVFSGGLTANINVVVPARGRQWKVINATTGAYTLTLKASGGSGFVVEQGATTDAYCDGASVFQAVAATGSPVSAIQAFATNSPPVGWLKANGAAVSRTAYSALFAALVTAAGFTAQTFTVTIASPGVFTKAAHGFLNGARVRLSSTGALPTGLNTATDYFVEVIDANTFYLATTLMGTRIVTSGSQSGTHTYLQSWFGLGDGSTTFNLPDLRGEFLRGWDDSRGIDPSRPFGSVQLSQNLAHTHSYVTRGQLLIRGVGGDGSFWEAIAAADTSSNGGSEARPRNIALLMCIKY